MLLYFRALYKDPHASQIEAQEPQSSFVVCLEETTSVIMVPNVGHHYDRGQRLC